MAASTTASSTSSAPVDPQSPGAVPHNQPDVYDLLCAVAAPVQWLSPHSGQTAGGVEGLYIADRRALARLTVTIEGADVRPIAGALTGSGSARFLARLFGLGDATGDPTVTLERHRTVFPDRGVERLTVVNSSRATLSTTLILAAGTDLAPIGLVRAGYPTALVAPEIRTGRDGLIWRSEDGYAASLVVTEQPAVADVAPEAGTVSWPLTLEPGQSWSAEVTIHMESEPARSQGSFVPLPVADPDALLTMPQVHSADHRFDEMVRTGFADLKALLLADSADPGDAYFAAGCPWYLTLFGRDSLWAARMSLPLGWRVAAGTLRALARRQGRAVDRATEEQPGKIPHELRPVDGATWLPPVYYGSIDATPLFVVTLAEAWRWGMPEDEVRALLPAAEAALAWMAAFGDADGDGFLEYLPGSTAGLTNQGWKDSDDAVRFADGTRATAPIALCEVQGYAYEAAMQGALLLEHFGRPGADGWRAWAGTLAQRFRQAFWIDDPDGAYPAIALDGRKRPVDGPASNMGHLLGTGILSQHEESLVAARLIGPDLFSGYGLRTLSARTAGYNPLSYHAGSVWPHDTAVAAYGLHRSGRTEQAAWLVSGLLAAAPHFGARLPELFGGHPTDTGLGPVPYPSACSPQAWAAAVAPVALTVMLGLRVDIPAGKQEQHPPRQFGVRELSIQGLPIGAHRPTDTAA
ncbi:glycogen debranching N-terminal domain-containing protein [Dactylosporangium sp. CA-233914]|uniref:glycogen debranching N-terminal domain-containing protein n=1 Tax=Dactylosporangium sp. CA-233914 TaxID=3239934 RepID=UPI003D90183E